jgi:exosome complex component RRP43
MDTFAKLHPREYTTRFLEQNIRPDARSLDAVRHVRVATGSLSDSCYGSALVRIGGTSVVAGVRAELGPCADADEAVLLVANVELLPICSPRFLPGRPPELARAVGAWMNDIVSGGRGRAGPRATSRRALLSAEPLVLSHLVPQQRTLASLGVIDDDSAASRGAAAVAAANDDGADQNAPQLAWHLSVDMYCLDYCGNVFDAALLALVAALRDCRLPTVSRDELGAYVCSRKRTVPLQFNFVPISTTFALIDQFIIADPTDAESELETASLSLVLDADGQIVSVRKPGGSPIAVGALKKCADIAKARIPAVLDALNNSVNQQRQQQ